MQGLQAGLDVGDGLGGVLKEDGMDAQLAGSHQRSLVVVKEDHLCWLHAKALTGQFKDASIRFGNPFLVRVNDEIGYLIKMVALLLFLPGPNKTITQKGGLAVCFLSP